MNLYQRFKEKYIVNKLSEICCEQQISLQPLVDHIEQCIEKNMPKDDVYLEFLQQIGNMAGKTTNALGQAASAVKQNIGPMTNQFLQGYQNSQNNNQNNNNQNNNQNNQNKNNSFNKQQVQKQITDLQNMLQKLGTNTQQINQTLSTFAQSLS